ncbi:magnesium-dependent phosphatase 1-like isoform X2 [Oratosquilla oratoria]|uniref:magnesium-dependent phosphatase 1-like isoform X2 n=1 Tax=Oratosquilla oratoria TaxID=337810 RepID=UPI003F75AF12
MRPISIGNKKDYTLWPFWVDTHVDPPFHKKLGKILDSCGKTVKPYPEVTSVLKHLQKEGYILAAASRTGEIDGANQLLKLFEWEKFFTYKEIYPGSKVHHFKRFQQASGLQYQEMLFFDDEHRNKVDLKKIDVLTIMVPDGVNHQLLKDGLKEFANLRKK